MVLGMPSTIAGSRNGLDDVLVHSDSAGLGSKLKCDDFRSAKALACPSYYIFVSVVSQTSFPLMKDVSRPRSGKLIGSNKF